MDIAKSPVCAKFPLHRLRPNQSPYFAYWQLKIIKSQHEFFKANNSEDLEHITNLKRIVVAISECLKSDNVSEDKVNDLVELLRRFSKTLYLNECIKYKDEDENEGKVREESEIWFDYIFKNEKYPQLPFLKSSIPALVCQ